MSRKSKLASSRVKSSKKPGEPEGPGIQKEIGAFVQQIESLATSLPFVMVTLVALASGASDKFSKFLEKHGKTIKSSKKQKAYTLPPQFRTQADKLQRECDNLKAGLTILPRQFVVSLVSQYDAFLGRLLRCLFYLQPGLLNATELNLSFAQLLEFRSLDSARDYLVEKEVEKILRMSHSDQFAWLENKFKTPLRKELLAWPIFVEVTERRNLFVHCNGVVSGQYLSVCKEHGVKWKDEAPKIGEQLGASREYFDEAYRCLFEIAVKLSQVLWRKLSKDNLEPADKNLTDITYDLIVAEQYPLALNLLEFATTVLKNHSTDICRRTLIINRAQTYKWVGQPDKCRELIKAEDWSACDSRFQLAVAVLQDDFKTAAKIMKSIGPNGEMDESSYKDWPLFKEFRKSSLFLETYKSIYGKPFSLVLTASVEEKNEGSANEQGNATQNPSTQ